MSSLTVATLRGAPRRAFAAARVAFEHVLPASSSPVYRVVAGATLRLHVVTPGQGSPDDAPRPAIVFFFGGAFCYGSARQFLPFCRAFANRGFVAMTAEYRTAWFHGSDVAASLADARAAVAWAMDHAADYRIDRRRIVLAGASSGGHLAASVALLPPILSSVPPRIAALVLYNPLLDTNPADAPRIWRLMTPLFGGDPLSLSPLRHVRPGAPPTLILHGDADRIVPIAHSERFRAAMLGQGNACAIERYPGRGHAFFNYGRGLFDDVVARSAAFLGQAGV